MVRRVGAALPVKEGLETKILLVKHPIVVQDPETGEYRYKSLPGEWVPIGSEAYAGESSIEAAVRAFRQKTFPKKNVATINPISAGSYRSDDKNGFEINDIEYFLLSPHRTDIRPSARGGLVDAQWRTPREWDEYIHSDEFETLQRLAFQAHADLTGLPLI